MDTIHSSLAGLQFPLFCQAQNRKNPLRITLSPNSEKTMDSFEKGMQIGTVADKKQPNQNGLLNNKRQILHICVLNGSITMIHANRIKETLSTNR